MELTLVGCQEDRAKINKYKNIYISHEGKWYRKIETIEQA